MVTLMPPGTQILTLGGFGATGDGRVQHSLPTVACQLIKAGLPAGMTVSTMTELLAAVEPTVELVATDLSAPVFYINTTQLPTLMSAAGALLIASSLASEDKLAFIVNRFTRDLLTLCTTSACDSRGKTAWPTRSLMAQLLTYMNSVIGATGQRLAASLSTGGDRIGTGLSLSLSVAQFQELSQGCLPTRTAFHQPGGQRARLAWPRVAHLLTSVGFTVQHPPTWFLT